MYKILDVVYSKEKMWIYCGAILRLNEGRSLRKVKKFKFKRLNKFDKLVCETCIILFSYVLENIVIEISVNSNSERYLLIKLFFIVVTLILLINSLFKLLKEYTTNNE